MSREEMDRVVEHREIIKRLFREHEWIAQFDLPADLEARCFFDDERGKYVLITLAWMKRKRISGNTLFLTAPWPRKASGEELFRSVKTAVLQVVRKFRLTYTPF